MRLCRRLPRIRRSPAAAFVAVHLAAGPFATGPRLARSAREARNGSSGDVPVVKGQNPVPDNLSGFVPLPRYDQDVARA